MERVPIRVEKIEAIARCITFIELVLNGKGRHAGYLVGEPLGLFFLFPQFVTVVRERGYRTSGDMKA